MNSLNREKRSEVGWSDATDPFDQKSYGTVVEEKNVGHINVEYSNIINRQMILNTYGVPILLLLAQTVEFHESNYLNPLVVS